MQPLIPLAGRPRVGAYGDGGFVVNGRPVSGSVILFPEGYLPWDVKDPADLDVAAFSAILDRARDLDLVLIGAGQKGGVLSADVRKELSSAYLSFEIMSTGAACRTLSALGDDERLVAAALIAV